MLILILVVVTPNYHISMYSLVANTVIHTKIYNIVEFCLTTHKHVSCTIAQVNITYSCIATSKQVLSISITYKTRITDICKG